jgi:hypothetical protein
VFLRVSRYLLLLTAVSLITMPVTEYLWTWDHFLQGGCDFELSSIVLLSFFCLVMVLSGSHKHCVDMLLSPRSCLTTLLNELVSHVVLVGGFLNLQEMSRPDPCLRTFDIRLQI